MTRRSPPPSRRAVMLGGAAAWSAAAAWAAEPERFTAFLGPTPLSDADRSKIRGRATATATLDGAQLSISGAFSGLVGPATAAELRAGAGVGVPGPAIAPLTVSPAVGGDISGRVALNAAQLKALRQGRLYIQINSQAAPDGNLWGWLLPPSIALPGGAGSSHGEDAR